MNLITTCSVEFADRATRLFQSYRRFYPEGKITVYTFGPEFTLPKVEMVQVPMLCEHAHNPRFYFFKTYAIYHAMHQDEDFLYLDSAHRILERPVDIEAALDSHTRFLVEYPDIPLKFDTTKKCFERMGALEERFLNAPCYWAAIQAWRPTKENKIFAGQFLEYMEDSEIAGPSNYLENPEPNNPTCRHHRNDQSCLSIMIEKFGFRQPYNDYIWARYGDHDTQRPVPEQPVIRGRQP